MKRFTLFLTLFLVIVFLIPAGYIALFPMYFYSAEYPMWKYAEDEISKKNHEDKTDILVVGDSRVIAGIIPKNLSPNARTIGVGGGSSVEIYFLLQHYFETHNAPKTVLLSLAPMHFRRMDGFWERCAKFGFLTLGETWRVLIRNQELNDQKIPVYQSVFTSIPFYGFANGLIYRISPRMAQLSRFLDAAAFHFNFFPYYQADLVAGRFFGNHKKNQAKLAEMRSGFGHAFYGTYNGVSAPNFEAKSGALTTSDLLDEYFEKTLALCRNHNVAVFYKTLPFSYTAFHMLTPEYATDFHAHLTSLLSRHPEVKAHDRIDWIPDRYFGDASHLNPAGAHFVTAMIREELSSDFPAARALSSESDAK